MPVVRMHKAGEWARLQRDHPDEWAALPALTKQLAETIQQEALLLAESNDAHLPEGNGTSVVADDDVPSELLCRRLIAAAGSDEERLRIFAAHAVGARCWFPAFHCICGHMKKHTLWPGVRLWLYMHPKEYRRINNSGKVLWHVFGEDSATLCIFGVEEHEDRLWSALTNPQHQRAYVLFPVAQLKALQVEHAEVPQVDIRPDPTLAMLDL
eukprot:jgi/Chlat1/3707/Chrsp251S03869